MTYPLPVSSELWVITSFWVWPLMTRRKITPSLSLLVIICAAICLPSSCTLQLMFELEWLSCFWNDVRSWNFYQDIIYQKIKALDKTEWNKMITYGAKFKDFRKNLRFDMIILIYRVCTVLFAALAHLSSLLANLTARLICQITSYWGLLFLSKLGILALNRFRKMSKMHTLGIFYKKPQNFLKLEVSYDFQVLMLEKFLIFSVIWSSSFLVGFLILNSQVNILGKKKTKTKLI